MNAERWRDELALLRVVIEKSGLSRTTKWGTDVYVHNGRNVLGLAGFRNYFALWFYNGVFLKDKYKVLVNAQEGKTKALRQWRFTSRSEINEKRILEYVREAIRNQDAGNVWKATRSPRATVPEMMLDFLKKDERLAKAFEKLTPYKRREYIEHISGAKKEETRIARMKKSIPMILRGAGLHDRYKQ